MRKILLFVLFLFFSSFVLAENTIQKTREKQVDAFLREFSSQAFKESYPNIFTAIKQVLILLPPDAFAKATNRAFPVLFTEAPHFGTGQWANSSGIYSEPNDPPTFTDGIWIIKLSTKLNETKDVEAIEGVIFHEIAHHVLGHKGGVFNPEIEKEANRLVKKWGFERQYLKAKEAFGSKATH